MKQIIVLALVACYAMLQPRVLYGQGNRPDNAGPGPIAEPILLEQDSDTATPQGIRNQEQIRQQDQLRIQTRDSQTQLEIVNREMERLMEREGDGGEVGNQLRTVAREQLKIQEQTRTQLYNLGSRSKLASMVLGPNYAVMKVLQLHMEQNQERVRELQVLQSQLQNQSDIEMIRSAVSSIIEQNAQIREQVRIEEQRKGLFGWLMKLLAGYDNA